MEKSINLLQEFNLRTAGGFIKYTSQDGKTIYTGDISLYDFKNIPNSRNLREPNPKSPCISDMTNSLVYTESGFRRNHSGVVILASDINSLDGRNLVLGAESSIGDGGHTALMAKMVAEMGNTFPNAYIGATIYDIREYTDEEIRAMVVSNNMSSAVTKDCLLDGTELAKNLEANLPKFIVDKLEIRKNSFANKKNEKGKPWGPKDFMKLKMFASICDYQNMYKYDCFNKDNSSHPKDSDIDALDSLNKGDIDVMKFITEVPNMIKLWEYLESDVTSVFSNKSFIERMKNEHKVDFSMLQVKPINKKKTVFYGYPVTYGSTGYLKKLLFAGLRACYAIDSEGNCYSVVGDILSFYEKYKLQIWRDLLIYAQSYMDENKQNHESKRFTNKESSFSTIYKGIKLLVMEEKMGNMSGSN